MKETQNPNMICVAAIAGAFGVKGEVKLKAFTQNAMDCVSYGPLLSADGEIVLTVISARAVKDALSVRAEEVKTREEAEGLKSMKVYVPRNALPETDEDDFYYVDLIGLEVKSTSGQRLGSIIGVHEFGAGDMLEIKPPKSAEKQASYFHPFTKAAVPKVDLKAGRIIVVPQIADTPPPHTPDGLSDAESETNP